jgi:hypothetical protein
MPRATHRLQRRKAALGRLDQAMREPSIVNVVHYSCETFYGRTDGTSPRATSIAVRNLGSSQNRSFSIHQIAEREGLSHGDIPAHYDKLEKGMLDEFFELVRLQSASYWVHWNMRDNTFGFPALEHRHRVLGGQPISIPGGRQIDLAALASDLYGPNYIPVPRLESLVILNDITRRDFLPGKDEALAFENRDYVRMHLSTLRKVDVIADILNRMWDQTLKTDATWKDKYGTRIGGVVEAVTDHWVYKALGFLGILAAITRLVGLIW